MTKLTHPEDTGGEEKIRGADTCDLCHCERDSEVSNSLTAPHIKLKEAKNLSRHVLSPLRKVGTDHFVAKSYTGSWPSGSIQGQICSHPSQKQPTGLEGQNCCHLYWPRDTSFSPRLLILCACLLPLETSSMFREGIFSPWHPILPCFPFCKLCSARLEGNKASAAAPRLSSPDILQIGSQRQHQGLLHIRIPFSPYKGINIDMISYTYMQFLHRFSFSSFASLKFLLSLTSCPISA